MNTNRNPESQAEIKGRSETRVANQPSQSDQVPCLEILY